jgi:hypothetical protein
MVATLLDQKLTRFVPQNNRVVAAKRTSLLKRQVLQSSE